VTARELATALAKDQETTATKIEDVLLALRDLMVEKLAAGEIVTIGRIGTFQVRPISRAGENKPTAAIRFRPLAEMREQLNLSDPHWEPTDICPECKERPRKKENLCATCRNSRRRRRAPVISLVRSSKGE
jgi:nucleoid DNA-binding protein